MSDRNVWPRPPASVLGWAIAAIVLVVIGVTVMGLALFSGGAFADLLTTGLLLGALAIPVALVSLVLSIRARRRARRDFSEL